MQEDADRESIQRISAAMVDEHVQQLRNERVDNPDRFTVTHSKSKQQIDPKPVDEEEEEDEGLRVRITEIQVKYVSS